MSKELELKLSGQDCPHAEPFCAGLNFMRQCKAPEDYSCDYRNPISKNLAMCRRYDNAINKILARTQDLQR